MSRSRKKSPVVWITCARSEKWDKVFAHRAYRASVRAALVHNHVVMPHFRELSDVWSFAKDGKFWTRRPGDWGARFWNK